MMAFRAIKQALINTLGANAAGNFAVEGYQRESHAAEEIWALPHVSVYYKRGAFPKGRGSMQNAQHEMTFPVDIIVAVPSSIDLSVIASPTATQQQLATALAANVPAAVAADALWDLTLEYVYQILKDPAITGTLGGIIANPWLDELNKTEGPAMGELYTLAGSINFTCSAPEYTTGSGPGTLMDYLDITFTETADITGAHYDTAKQGAAVGSATSYGAP